MTIILPGALVEKKACSYLERNRVNFILDANTNSEGWKKEWQNGWVRGSRTVLLAAYALRGRQTLLLFLLS